MYTGIGEKNAYRKEGKRQMYDYDDLDNDANHNNNNNYYYLIN
jgi:hypothetical protein